MSADDVGVETARSGRRPRRTAVVLSLVALLVAGLVADRVVHRAPGPAGVTASAETPSQAPAGALSSTWFCPPTTSAPNGLADGRLIIANPSNNVLTGTLTVVPSDGQPVRSQIAVDAHNRKSIRPGDLVRSAYAAAVVQLDGSIGGVEQQIRGALGESVAPCATHAADHWYFAAGTTLAGTQLLLSLFNPFPADAIVDLTFATDTGPFTPADLQGVVVPGGGVIVIDLGQHVRRRQTISTTVVARSGQVVADKIQLVGTSASTPGVAAAPTTTTPRGTPPSAAPKAAVLVLGVPLLGSGQAWYFPDGVAAAGLDERYELYNPSDHDANVQLTLLLQQGSADPFQVVVPAHDRLTFVVNQQNRIPSGVAHSAVVESTNSVPFVVERVISASPPSTHAGVSDLTGSPTGSAHWVFGAGAANDAQDEWLVAFNPGNAPTHLSVTAMLTGHVLPVEGLQQLEIGAGERLAMRLGDHLTRGDLMLTLDADGPVVVERDLYRVGGPGISASLGIPSP